MKKELKKEFQENQKAIFGRRKVSKEERKRLVERNKEILKILESEEK